MTILKEYNVLILLHVAIEMMDHHYNNNKYAL